MSISIAGSTGFVGSALVETFKKSGVAFHYLTRNSSKSEGLSNYHVADLEIPNNALSQFITTFDTFVNCSGELVDVNKMRPLHVEATRNLLGLLAKSRQQHQTLFHWIQLSSCGAYGSVTPPNKARYVTELTQESPAGEYEITKTEADHLIMTFAKEHDWFKYTIIRPTIVFGIGMRSGIILNLAKMIQKRLFFYVENKGSIANFVHVDDVVQAVVLSLRQPSAYNQTFIVANDCQFNIYVNQIADALQVVRPFLVFPACVVKLSINVVGNFFSLPISTKQIDVMMRKTYYSTDKIKNKLNWQPSPILNQLETYISASLRQKN